MKHVLIIGLGNPGPGYAKTRHSIGFMVVDALAEHYNFSPWRTHALYQSSEGNIDNIAITAIKPLTFMNKSGEVLPQFTKKGFGPDNIIVIHDELEQPFGKVTARKGGSARGHNGLKSIISYIGDSFYRVRVGIGRPENNDDVSRYVLAPFSQSQTELDSVIDKAVKVTKEICEQIVQSL